MKTHKPKKSLGQNFLKSQKALSQIITAGNVTTADTVLEIGPGKGVLTERLLQTGASVVAIEKDSELVLYLQEKFEKEIANGKLKLIEEDILKFEFGRPFNGTSGRHDSAESYNLTPNAYKIVANIPYNITGAILRKFLETPTQPTTMVLLVQKEVAMRIARDKKESLLSLSIKAYGTATYVSTVSKRYFSPAPKVDSAIISIQNISRKNFATIAQEESFFRLIKAAFAHKRKQLVGNLKEAGYENTLIEKQFALHHLSSSIRAEDIGISTWLLLAKVLVGTV